MYFFKSSRQGVFRKYCPVSGAINHQILIDLVNHHQILKLMILWNFSLGVSTTKMKYYIYGSNFSGWIICQMNVTFSLTLSLNYTKFCYGMTKDKMFSDISFQIRVRIYLQIISKLAICV